MLQPFSAMCSSDAHEQSCWYEGTEYAGSVLWALCYALRMRVLIMLVCLSLCSAVAAQTPPVALGNRENIADVSGAAKLRQLTELRLSIRSERTTAGLWLLGFGLASTLAGGVVAIVGRHERAWLAGGLTTASFGVVNAALSFGLLDAWGADHARIIATHEPHTFAELRERELIAHLHSGQFFAVNAGLDVFYMASGGLLCALAAVRDEPDRWELGAGLALVVQGAFLMAFDIVNWLRSNERASRFRALPQ